MQNLGTAETQTFDMQRPMRALALDPDYGKHSTCEVITGGMSGLLVLHERGWLGQKEVTLHAGEGPIWSISRRGSLIAWANDESFRIYDLKSNSMIGHFPRDQQAPEEEAPRADLFRCSFVWKNNRELVVAWADYIKVVHIKEQPKSRAVPGIGVAAALFGEVAAIFQVDCMIAGLTLHEHHILILAYPSEDGDDDDEAPLPELRLISNDGEELSSDALSIPNSKQYQCHDYLLSSFIPPQSDTISPNTSQDQTFYVVTPKDVIEARSRDAADHVLWLVEHELYAEALQAVEQSGLSHEKGFDVLGVGLKYLYHLLDIGDYERAASQSPTILGHRQQQWEDWVFAFIEHDQIQASFR